MKYLAGLVTSACIAVMWWALTVPNGTPAANLDAGTTAFLWIGMAGLSVCFLGSILTGLGLFDTKQH